MKYKHSSKNVLQLIYKVFHYMCLMKTGLWLKNGVHFLSLQGFLAATFFGYTLSKIFCNFCTVFRKLFLVARNLCCKWNTLSINKMFSCEHAMKHPVHLSCKYFFLHYSSLILKLPILCHFIKRQNLKTSVTNNLLFFTMAWLEEKNTIYYPQLTPERSHFNPIDGSTKNYLHLTIRHIIKTAE